MVKYTLSEKEEMRNHVEQYGNSGMTIKSYCKAHSIKEHVFHYWKAKYNKPVVEQGDFISLPSVKGYGIAETGMEVIFPSGLCIRFSKVIPIDYLKALCCI